MLNPSNVFDQSVEAPSIEVCCYLFIYSLLFSSPRVFFSLLLLRLISYACSDICLPSILYEEKNITI